MTRISQPLTAEPEIDDEAALTRTTVQNLRWKVILVWFLRLSALLCMVRGLSYWAELLGMFQVDFTDRPVLQQGAIVFFSAIYCFAAVGLWMAAAWGGAIWFLALLGEILFLALEPGVKLDAVDTISAPGPLSSPGYLLVGLFLIAIYLTLYVLAAREER